MMSSEEETNEPMGFTLNITKFNRSMNNRQGTKKTRPLPSSSKKAPVSPIAFDEREVSIDSDSDCVVLDSPDSNLSKPRSRDDPASAKRRTKKRSRKQVLATLSANARKMSIPIPSFQMIKKRRQSDSHWKKLSRLEREFFNEDGDENSAGNSSSKGERISAKANPNNGQNVAKAANYVCKEINRATTTDLVNLLSDIESPSDCINLLEQRGPDTEAMFEDNHFEAECSSPASKKQQNQILDEKVICPNPHSPNPPHKQQGKRNTTVESKILETGGKEPAKECDSNADGTVPQLFDTNDYRKESISTDVGKSESTTSVEINENSVKQPIEESFDLENEVDLLFLKADTNTITLNMIYKQVEQLIGASLKKATKKKVKARVMALLHGKVKPSSGAKQVFNSAGGQDRNSESEQLRLSRVNSTGSALAITEKNNVDKNNLKECTKLEKGHDKDDEIQHNMKNAVIDTQSAVEKFCEAEAVKDDEIHNEKNAVIDTQSAVEKFCEAEAVSEKRCNSSPIVVEDEQETIVMSKEAFRNKNDRLDQQQSEESNTSMCLIANQSSIEVECAIIDPNDTPKESLQNKSGHICGSNPQKNENCGIPSDFVANQKLDVKPESDNVTKSDVNPESDNVTKSKKKDTKSKRQRKKKQKLQDEEEKPNSSAATAIPDKKPSRTRKRPRKATACALCKTCPCQKVNTHDDTENLATLDIKNFSRSEGAVEKTLLRRLQKLEKSTEHMAEQTESVRRRLKKHKRDMLKREQRLHEKLNGSIANDRKSADSYFLPDAEVFERVQNESQGLSKSVVGKAQNRVFQNVPTYQPTLFELMGIPRADDKTKQITESGDLDTKSDQCINNTGDMDTDRTIDTIGCFDCDDDSDIPAEYVPERESEDRIHRLEWNNGARNNNGLEEPGTTTKSIFDLVLKIHNESNNMNEQKEKLIPLWDDLFDSVSGKNGDDKSGTDTEGGLNDLLCLFDSATPDPNRNDDDIKSIESSNDERRVDASLLSQGAQGVAADVISSIKSRTQMVATLEHSYPNWKENIYFSLIQKDSTDLKDALDNVQQSRMRLQALKEQMLNALEGRDAALEVFETALKTSLDRATKKSSPT